MIFPYDSNSRFSDPKAARPTQRPASNSESRKRAHPSGFSPKDGAFGQQLAGPDGVSDPHLDNGFAEVIRKAKAEAWDEGHRASERDWELLYDLVTPDEDRQPWTNPYGGVS